MTGGRVSLPIHLDAGACTSYNKDEKGITPTNGYVPRKLSENSRLSLETEGGYFFCIRSTRTISNTIKIFISFMSITPIRKRIGANANRLPLYV